MDKDKKEIREEDLEAVNGGTHLTSDEIKNLQLDQQLILENNFGGDIALVAYEGELRDPGALSMMQAKVRIVKIYDRGVYKNGDTFSSWVGERPLEVGDVIWASRYYLDFPEKA